MVIEQLAIPFRDERRLRAFLESASGRAIKMKLTDNSARMVSVRGVGDGVALRLHRMFLSAPEDVLMELAAFIMRRAARTPLVSRFIRERHGEIRKKPRGGEPLRTLGKAHDLKGVFDSVNREYFGGGIAASITWSRKKPGRVRQRTLGSYSFVSGTIRVNTVLDTPAVPGFLVEFIVYHEMLHAFLGVGRRGGRRSVHNAAFREKEKEFKQFRLAAAWVRAGGRLL